MSSVVSALFSPAGFSDSSTPAPPEGKFSLLGSSGLRAVPLSDVPVIPFESRSGKGAVRVTVLSESPHHVNGAFRDSVSSAKARNSLRSGRRRHKWVCRPARSAHSLSRGGHRSGERVQQGGQGTQSRVWAPDGPGALLTTRWAAYRRGFDSRWQPRVVHAFRRSRGCLGQHLLRSQAWSLESVWMHSLLGSLRTRGGELRTIPYSTNLLGSSRAQASGEEETGWGSGALAITPTRTGWTAFVNAD